MRLLLVCAILVTSTMSQRPSYAGTGPIGRPGLASRFKDENAESTTVPVALNNRVGEVSTERIPVDARGDEDLVNRLNQWPREHRPFWLLNAEHIEAARNQQAASNNNMSANANGGNTIANRNTFEDASSGTITAKPLPPRSPFLPPLDG